ncbi:hypothetical protein BaRGS_00039867 [Batillaria attramentaria]|uniref:Uncharacterized protein n=1 Tax=Batillaria attramentaria TaxID=370345 RepID=A0ABD0J216_9CAEN
MFTVKVFLFLFTGQIDFPTINSSVITVESGTTVTLPFTLNIDSCMDTSGDLEVMVTSNESGLLCHIEMLDDSCYLVDGACNCLPARHEFQVNVTVDQSDSSSRLMFRARVSTGQEFNAELFVNLITCEPEFQLDGNKSEISVVPGQTIEVEFPVKSHTTHFKNCQLSRGSSKRDDRITASSNPAGKLEMDAVVFRKRNSGKDLSRQSSFCAPNIYWEIPDKPESIALPFDAPPPPPCRKALRPRSDVLYLTPSMSPDIPAALDSTKRNRMRPVSEIASPTYRRRANNLPEPEDGLTPFAAQATPSAVQTTPKDLSIKDDLLFKTSPRVPFGPCQDLQAPLKTDSNLSDKFSRPKSLPVSGLSLFGDDLSLSVKISRLPFGSCPDLQASVTPGSNSSDDYSTASSVEKQRRQTDSDYVPMTRGPGRYFGENQGKKLHHQMSCGANKSRGKQGRKSDGGFFQTSRGSDGYFGDQGKKLDPGYVQMSRGANSCHLSGNLGRKADCDYVSMCRGSSSPSGENQGREVEPFYVPMSPGANSSQFTEKLGKEADSGHDPVSLGVDNIERGREADDDYVPMSREVFFAHENVPSASFPTESGSNESGEDFRYHQDDVNVFHN